MGSRTEVEAEKEVADADLQNNMSSSHVPYFRAKDPSLKADNKLGTKPKEISTIVFMLTWLFVSPLWGSHGWTLTSVALGICIAALYIEFASGLLHIVFDNEKLNSLPILGSLTHDFQMHHIQPARVTQISIWSHLQDCHLPGVMMLCWQIVCLRGRDALRPFWFFSIAMLHLMYMTHRWSHLPSSRLHPLVRWGQRNGLLLSMHQHLQHHRTFDCNYSLLTGWSTNLLNAAVRKWRADSLGYLPAFMMFLSAPTLLGLSGID